MIDAEPQLRTAQPVRRAVQLPRRAGWLRILHIEDNQADALLAQEHLRGMGTAVEFDLAVRLADLTVERAAGADCAILDLSLPDAVGLEALVAVRAMSEHLPIIVLTGFADLELGLSALRYGADDYLVKNHVDGYTLERAIRYAIERRRLTVEVASLDRAAIEEGAPAQWVRSVASAMTDLPGGDAPPPEFISHLITAFSAYATVHQTETLEAALTAEIDARIAAVLRPRSTLG